MRGPAERPRSRHRARWWRRRPAHAIRRARSTRSIPRVPRPRVADRRSRRRAYAGAPECRRCRGRSRRTRAGRRHWRAREASRSLPDAMRLAVRATPDPAAARSVAPPRNRRRARRWSRRADHLQRSFRPAHLRCHGDSRRRWRRRHSYSRRHTGSEGRRSLELLRHLDDDRAFLAIRGPRRLGRLARQLLLLLAYLAQAGQEHGLALRVLLVGDATLLELDLELEELLAHRLVVVQLMLGVFDDLVDAIANADDRRGERKREEL